VHQPWRDDCIRQACEALAAVDRMAENGAPYLLLERLTQADITTAVAERLARGGLGIDTAVRFPHLARLTQRLADEQPFRSTEP
jgi:glutathione S-transferase